MARRDNAGRLRQAAGAPASIGGQFAQESTPGAAVKLSAADAEAFRDLHDRVRHDVRSRFAGRIDPDDVISIMQEKAAIALSRGKIRNIHENIGYLRQTARSAAVELAFPGQPNGRTRKAARMLIDECEAFKQKELRSPNSREYDEIADRIRSSLPAAQRPTRGFQHTVFGEQEVYSLDAPLLPGATVNHIDLQPAEETSALSSWEALAAHRNDNFGQRGLTDKQVKARLWAAARSDNDDIPPIQRLNRTQAAAAREAFEQLDLPTTLSEYDYEGDKTPGLAVIMAPFGGMERTTPAQRAAVVETLTRAPKFSGHLWRLALDQANAT